MSCLKLTSKNSKTNMKYTLLKHGIIYQERKIIVTTAYEDFRGKNICDPHRRVPHIRIRVEWVSPHRFKVNWEWSKVLEVHLVLHTLHYKDHYRPFYWVKRYLTCLHNREWIWERLGCIPTTLSFFPNHDCTEKNSPSKTSLTKSSKEITKNREGW